MGRRHENAEKEVKKSVTSGNVSAVFQKGFSCISHTGAIKYSTRGEKVELRNFLYLIYIKATYAYTY